jgi:predicted alpha/beta-hydrolase family hydrolase
VAELFHTDAVGDPRGVVLMLHGGAERGERVVDERSASWRRTRWMYSTLAPRFADEGYAIELLQFTLRGWNVRPGQEPAPVADARWALDDLRERYGELSVVLLGHSMGARTGLHVADDASVVGLVGLAPWWPAGEPVDAVRDLHVVAAHGRRDRITSARQTRSLLERAEPLAASTTFVDMGLLGHYMLTHVRRWNRVALRETLRTFDPGG